MLSPKIEQDRARFEDREWVTADTRQMIDQNRNLRIRIEPPERIRELPPPVNSYGYPAIGRAKLFQHQHDFERIRRQAEMKVIACLWRSAHAGAKMPVQNAPTIARPTMMHHASANSRICSGAWRNSMKSSST